MKKLFTLFSIFFMFLIFGTYVNAQEAVSVEKKPVPVSTIRPFCKYFKVTPGNPLHLKGTGSMFAEGHGEAFFRIVRGRVSLEGKGVVALKVSNNDQVDVSGMGGHIEIGDWILYWGKGKLTVTGDDYQVVAFGRFSLRSSGRGSVVLKGNWKGRYCRLFIAHPEPIPQIIPESLKREVE